MMRKLYFFIVHSHYDVAKVTTVRHLFEKNGVIPITFFLDEKNDNIRIDKLIKDEIDCRVWFVYCKSAAARNSKWVQSELAYIKKANRQIDIEIDLDQSFSDTYLHSNVASAIRLQIEAIKRASSIFCTYAKEDERALNQINKYLISKNCDVYTYSLGGKWAPEDTYSIQHSSAVVAYISKESLKSEYVVKMLELAVKWEKPFLPVFLDDIDVLKNQEAFRFLKDLDGFRFDLDYIDKSCQAMLRNYLSLIIKTKNY